MSLALRSALRHGQLRPLGALCALLLGCGSRSSLTPDAPCEDGSERPCEDGCGTGAQVCVDGEWSACQVPRVTESCEDECGVGQRTCEGGSFGACVVPPVMRSCQTVCGSGTETCEGGAWGRCTAPRPLPPVLDAVIRDFSDSHPDFQANRVDRDPGIVESRLGPDDKPVYARELGGTLTTTGRASFDQWYRDVPGVNLSQPIELPLSTLPDDDRLFVYSGRSFFPIDDALLGNEGRARNYHFTLEAVAQFDYLGGEVFEFEGDDDLWVFVNGLLAIDLGGVHATLTGSVEMDEIAGRADLVVGNRYSLHLFFAERQTFESNFSIQTSIATQGECPGP